MYASGYLKKRKEREFAYSETSSEKDKCWEGLQNESLYVLKIKRKDCFGINEKQGHKQNLCRKTLISLQSKPFSFLTLLFLFLVESAKHGGQAATSFYKRAAQTS
jgi:hypothetical protein